VGVNRSTPEPPITLLSSLKNHIEQVEGLAVDHANALLYVGDKVKRVIQVCDYDRPKCAVLIYSQGNIRGVALDVERGLVFWTDWGKEKPGIERAIMDGSGRRFIVDQDIVWPNGIALDSPQGTVYWVDARLNRLERSDVNGKNRKVLIRDLNHPFGLAVFENRIYWSEMESSAIETTQKSGPAHRTLLFRTNNLPVGIFIYHPLLQPEHNIIPFCTDKQFLCHNALRCIPASWRCDRERDCEDGSDESSCDSTVRCLPGQFACANGVGCIPERWRCDGETECDDKSDEVGCPAVKTGLGADTKKPGHKNTSQKSWPCNPKTEFLCELSNRCIGLEHKCDGFTDCPFGLDEMFCGSSLAVTDKTLHGVHSEKPRAKQLLTSAVLTESTTTVTTAITAAITQQPHCADPSDFLCTNGMCIQKENRCDGIKDCDHGEDEANCPAKNPCLQRPTPCRHPHRCQQTVISPTGFRCICPAGFMQSKNGTCHDFDECARNIHLCSQKCKNKPGSYVCTCEDGYLLDIDGVTCQATGVSPQIFFVGGNAGGSYVRSVVLRPEAYSVDLTTLPPTVIAVAYDGALGRLFWATHEGSAGAVVSGQYGNLQGTTRVILDETSVKSPQGLAVDWLNHLLYVTDTESGRILACSYEGARCAVIVHTPGGKLRGIAVYPQIRRMFWTDFSDTAPRIETAGMDGSDRHLIASRDVQWPNGIAVDYSQDRVYWVDSGTHLLERARLDGSEREELLAHLPHPFGLAVFENSIYFTDLDNRQMEVVDKTTARRRRVLVSDAGLLKGLYTYHPLNQPTGRNPCASARCAYLCLLSSSAAHGYVCVGSATSPGLVVAIPGEPTAPQHPNYKWFVPGFFAMALIAITLTFAVYAYRKELIIFRSQTLPRLRRPLVLWRKRTVSDAKDFLHNDQVQHLSPDLPKMQSFDNPSYVHHV
jgi:sugar lactone lactonase YvrE